MSEDIIKNVMKNGGPAFPVTINLPDGGEFIAHGLTLRDWFAGLAMQAIIQSFNGFTNDGGEYVAVSPANAAGDAYDHADAMLAARTKGAEQ